MEYLLLFGVPENKVEGLYDGRARVCQAFPSPEEARAQLRAWEGELERWQGGRTHRFELSREHCVVQLLVPLNWPVHFNAQSLLAPPVAVDRWRLQRNLQSILGLAPCHGTELMIPGGMVSPFLYCFTRERAREALVGQAYYEGVPDLVVEILPPADKLAFYREQGVPEVWCLDPVARTVEAFGAGPESSALVFEGAISPRSPGEMWERDPGPVGLADFLVGGAPRGSYEFYGGRARRRLAWETEEEAEHHARSVLAEFARWAGPFALQREGAVVTVDVSVDVAVHRRFLRYWHFDGNWRG